jgi:hypothetical protein
MSETTTPDARTFSPAAYAALIAALRERGYRTFDFAGAEPGARHLILRHDVDFSLAAAMAMAEQEAALGVASTYFVLLRTEFYNPLSGEGLAALARLTGLGHAVGLHFDAALYDAGAIEAAVAKECGLLEAAVGRPVTIVSFHRPAPDLIGRADRIAGRLNVYGRRFVQDMGYCSDSRGIWGHGAPLDHPAVAAGRALHLLVHPFWWTAPPLPPRERLRNFLRERAAFLDRELAQHCVVHRSGS